MIPFVVAYVARGLWHLVPYALCAIGVSAGASAWVHR